jgi:hypothetical protein
VCVSNFKATCMSWHTAVACCGHNATSQARHHPAAGLLLPYSSVLGHVLPAKAGMLPAALSLPWLSVLPCCARLRRWLLVPWPWLVVAAGS